MPGPKLLPELWECPEPYCMPGPSSEICAKFGGELMGRWLAIFDEMGPKRWSGVTLDLIE